MERKKALSENLPEKVRDVKISYVALKQAIQTREKELGKGNYDGDDGKLYFDGGEIDLRSAQAIKDKFSDLLPRISGDLPEAILLSQNVEFVDFDHEGKPSRYATGIVGGTDYSKSGKITLIVGTGPVTIHYFIPQTGEVYSITPKYNPISHTTYPTETKYFPDSSDFMGIDEIKREKKPIELYFGEGQFTTDEIETVLEHARQALANSPKKHLLECTLHEIEEIKEQAENSKRQLASTFGILIKQRMLNLIDSISRNYGGRILPGYIWITFVRGLADHKSEGLYILPHDRRLVFAPESKQRVPLLGVRERVELKMASDAPIEAWCRISLIGARKLLDKLPKQDWEALDVYGSD